MVYVDVSNWRVVGADMVFVACDSKAFAGNLSVPASGFSFGIRLYSLAYRSNWFNRSYPQGKT
jgi:hypothetical protein